MKYDFYCNSCKHSFDLDMSLEEYLDHMPKTTGYGTVVSRFFACSLCGSLDTRRDYQAPYVIYKGEGFTKSVKEDE